VPRWAEKSITYDGVFHDHTIPAEESDGEEDELDYDEYSMNGMMYGMRR